jgi:hypothetical protein
VLLLLGGEKSHDTTAACPLTDQIELHLQIEFTAAICPPLLRKSAAVYALGPAVQILAGHVTKVKFQSLLSHVPLDAVTSPSMK